MTENLPVHWEEELAKSAKEVASLERPAVSQISTRAGVLSYQKQPVPGNKLPCIIIASCFENKYFTGAFNPDKYESPACYALSLNGEEMIPHDDAKNKQDTSCDRCEKSKWGSQGAGKKGKACKEVRRLALLPAGCIESGNILTAELAVLSIPVTSIRNWAAYINGVAAEYRRPPWAVITEVRTEPDAKTQFQIRFQTLGIVGDDNLGALHQRIEGAQEILMTPYDDSGTVAGLPDPAPLKDRKY